MSAADVVVYAWDKTPREQVRAMLRVFNGRELADVRVFVPNEDGGWKPTQKGLAIRREQLPELRDAVEALIMAATVEEAA